MSTQPVCLYHAECCDGFAAATAVWHYHRRDRMAGPMPEFFPCKYDGPIPAIARFRGASVVMVDFSLPRQTMLDVAAVAETVLVLDHHKTAQDALVDLPENVCVKFDMNSSGAALAWRYFHQFIDLPPVIAHVQDRDLWRFQMPGSREVHASLMSHPRDFETWINLVLDGPAPLIADGKPILRQHDVLVGTMVREGRSKMRLGPNRVQVPVCNVPFMFASDVAHALFDARGDAPFAATYCDMADGRRHFSLRSGPEGADVEAVAKHYGGGGHRNAAGFSMPSHWSGERTPGSSFG
jgi:hypothetical protein